MPTWDELYRQGLAWIEPQPWVVESVPALRAAGVRDLYDFGCGTGRHTVYLARQGFRTFGSDIAPHGLRYCRDWLSHEDLPERLALADLRAIPFTAGSFDAVLSIQVLYHARRAEMQTAIAEIARVLRPGGMFVGSLLSDRTWKAGEGVCLEAGTFVQERGPEAGVPHHYSDEADVRSLLAGFAIDALRLDEQIKDGELHSHWEFVARCEHGSR